MLTLAHVPIFDAELVILLSAVAWGLYVGGSAWLLYVALEPFARRVWPERLVSWTRLLAGNAGDPMVARDVLIGTTSAWGLCAANNLLPQLLPAGPLVFAQHSLEPLLGISDRLASTAFALFSAVRFGLLCLLLLLLLRLGGRFRVLAHAGLGVVLLAIMYTAVSGHARNGHVDGACALGALRSGRRAAPRPSWPARHGSRSLRDVCLALSAPNDTADRVVRGCTWWMIGVTVLLVVYGLYFSTGGRPLGEGRLLEE